MTNANNSNNNCAGGTTVSSGQWISAAPSKQYTITIPSNICSTGGTIIFTGGTGQISFDDIDLAVPVDEKKDISDGCTCKKCKEYYQYAEPNQEDGTLICYGCRMVW
jgi:hypothetical protein